MRMLTACALLTVLALLSPGSLHAQQGGAPAIPDSVRDDLSDSELQEFRRDQLSVVVETERETTHTVNTYGWLYGSPYLTTATGTVRSDEIKDWTFYHGFREVSEPELFRVAGYHREASQADSYLNPSHSGDILLTMGGLGLIAGGVVACATGQDAIDKARNACGNPGVATFGLLGGAVVTGIGINGWTSEPSGPWAPPEKIRAVASEYNRQLFEEYTEADDATSRLPSWSVGLKYPVNVF